MQSKMKKSLILGIICGLIVVSFPTITGEIDYYHNSIVLILGKCNITGCGGIWWKFGLYIPMVKRNVFIIANDEKNESINALILSFKDGFGTYINHKDIRIDLQKARGLFYWGGKSILFNHSDPPPIFILCRAKTAQIIT